MRKSDEQSGRTPPPLPAIVWAAIFGAGFLVLYLTLR